jgi:hypothetical protein
MGECAGMSLELPGFLHALREDPDLAFRVRRREPAIAYRRELQIGRVSTSVRGSPVQALHVIDVDVDKRRRGLPKTLRGRESLARLTHHHQAIVSENELGVYPTRSPGLREALVKPERLGQVVDSGRRVFVQEVRTHPCVAGWRVLHGFWLPGGLG